MKKATLLQKFRQSSVKNEFSSIHSRFRAYFNNMICTFNGGQIMLYHNYRIALSHQLFEVKNHSLLFVPMQTN